MRTLVLLALLATITACGSTATRQEPTQTDFIMVSEGKASFLYDVFVGGVKYCKVTKHGIPHVNFDGAISYDGEKCEVHVEAGAKDVSD